MARRVAVVHHTHWDREWYLPFETYRARLVSMLDALLDELLAADSQDVFLLDGQVAVVDDYLEIRPEREAQFAQLVTSGRLSIGPWYVLPDEFLVSGETLIRNLEMGLRRATDFGGAMQIGYLPDMFGHIAQMPQILRSFGFEHAVVWRGVPSEVAATAFRWRAPDGSALRAEYLPQGYGNGARLPADPDLAVDLISNFEAANAALLGEEILWMHGADHQAPTPQLAERLAELNAAQEHYDLRLTPLPEYLESAPNDDLPEWWGELRSGARSNLLMGVVSNRVDIRHAAGEVELLLERLAEPVAALFGSDQSWPAAELERAWRMVVLNSAHDSICGCSLDEVCNAVVDRYATARQIAENILDNFLSEFASSLATAGPTVVNPCAHARSGLVELLVVGGDPLPDHHQVLKESSGQTIMEGLTCAVLPEMVQRELEIFRDTSDVSAETHGDTVQVVIDATSTGEFAPAGLLASLRSLAATEPDRAARVITLTRPCTVVLAPTPTVPGFGWASVTSSTDQPKGVEVGGMHLESDRLRVEIDPHTATFTLNGQALGRLIDGGDVGDTYNYCAPQSDAPEHAALASDVRVVEPGPLRGRLEYDSDIGGILVTTGLELRAGEDFLRSTLSFHNSETDHRLRVLHDLPRAASDSIAGCAFGTVRRALEAEGGPTEAPLPTYPARGFISAGGLTVAAVGSFEYEIVESARGQSMAITLVRSTGWLSRGPMRSRPLPAGPEIPLTGSQVQKAVTFDQVIGLDVADPFTLYDAAFIPLLTVTGTGAGALAATGTAAASTGGVISAIRRIEDQLEVRVFNPTETPQEFVFGATRTELSPWEIRTLRLDRPEVGQ
jgi:mannosylglycerate hydrolase